MAKQPNNGGRKSKSKSKRGLQLDNAPPSIDQLDMINVHAAGIDIGDERHFVAVPDGRDAECSVRSFGTFTADLEGICDWLAQCGIETVAMESTGVYWIPLFEMLESRGFKVIVCEASQIKKFRRKTDVLDCQWIQTLHCFGLLHGSFRPEDRILPLRGYMRQRDMLIKYCSDHVRHMQKALQQMNIKLTKVVSDITGKTGMSIIRAILAGERDPLTLAKFRDDRCKNDEATIALSLRGNWREEHLLALRQAVDLFEYYQEKMQEVDTEIERYLASFEDKADGQRKPTGKKRRRDHRTPQFDIRNSLYRMTGVDLTDIDGIGRHTALQIVSEIGHDMTAWDTEKHFVSWLSLCPELNLSGGSRKSRGSKTHASKNRVATSLRVSAQALLKSKTALGAFGRRQRSKKGPAHAITAVARKLAIIVYNMLKHGRAYVDRGQDYYESQYQDRQRKSLLRRAHDLGYKLVPEN